MKHALNIGMWLLVAFSAVSCQKERAASDGEREVFVSLDTRASDENVTSGDNTFQSLVFYFFTDSGENSKAIFRSFQPGRDTYEEVFRLPNEATRVVVIANYEDCDLERTLSLTMNYDELTQLIATKSLDFQPDQLLMLGEAVVPQSGQMNIQLVRMVARVDVHVFGTQELITGRTVKVRSVSLAGQVLNTTMIPGDAGMPADLVTRNRLKDELDYTVVQRPAEVTSAVVPAARFYSFQYAPAAGSAESAPELTVVLDVDGLEMTRTCRVADASHPDGKLLRNTIYRVLAEVKSSGISVSVDVLDWETEESDIEWGDVSTATFECGPMTPPSTADGELTVVYDQIPGDARMQSFEFYITAPVGALWNASLTNSTDFAFSDINGGVQNGVVVAGGQPAYIRVMATSPYHQVQGADGSMTDPSTRLVISLQKAGTSDFEALLINPDLLYGSTDAHVYQIVQKEQ